jgi:Na+/H+ antiporter NhaD/arsenite permease-like protein
MFALRTPHADLIGASAIFLATYLVFAIGRFPWTTIDRSAMAIIGATLMVGCRIVGPGQAIASIDFGTIVLLFSMMLIVASLHHAGLFDWIVELVVAHVKPEHLLPSVVFASGLLSSVLINDIVCLVMAPLVARLCRQFSKPPVPYLLALATAANIGSVATMTGNPQNILIGSLSGLSYREFLWHLGPIAAIGLVLDWRILEWLYPRRSIASSTPHVPVARSHTGVRRLAWPVAVALLVLVGLIAGEPPALVSSLGGALLLVRRSVDPRRIYGEIDWSLLVLFVGLFVVTGAVEQSGLAQHLLSVADTVNLRNRWMFTAVVVFLSNLVSNVPAVMLLKGVVPQLGNPHQWWLLLAATSTFAGNLTITGSVANIIVVENSGTDIRIGFCEYVRVGVPVTLATLGAALLWLSIWT